MSGHQSQGERTVPYVCPFCGEEDIRPAEDDRWHCRSCLRLFTVTFHGLTHSTMTYPAPTSAARTPTPAAGIHRVDFTRTTPGADDPDDDPDVDDLDDDPDVDDDPDDNPDGIDRAPAVDDGNAPGGPR